MFSSSMARVRPDEAARRARAAGHQHGGLRLRNEALQRAPALLSNRLTTATSGSSATPYCESARSHLHHADGDRLDVRRLDNWRLARPNARRRRRARYTDPENDHAGEANDREGT